MAIGAVFFRLNGYHFSNYSGKLVRLHNFYVTFLFFRIKIALAHPAASNGVFPRQRCRLLYF